jgi:hypothetical protein
MLIPLSAHRPSESRCVSTTEWHRKRLAAVGIDKNCPMPAPCKIVGRVVADNNQRAAFAVLSPLCELPVRRYDELVEPEHPALQILLKHVSMLMAQWLRATQERVETNPGGSSAMRVIVQPHRAILNHRNASRLDQGPSCWRHYILLVEVDAMLVLGR